MRVIKFRTWEKQRDGKYKMEYKPFVYDGECLGEFSMVNLNKALMDNKDYILMQFTNLYDKNGKEIWEGDIIKSYYSDYIVLWDVDSWAIHCISSSKAGSSERFLLKNGHVCSSKYKSPVRVIGNIYENPELLKNKKGERVRIK